MKVEIGSNNLNMRRVIFVYEAARLAAQAANAPIIPKPFSEQEEAFQIQFFDVIEQQCGYDCNMSAEELHEDWVKAYERMGWTFGLTRDPEAKTHPYMVPYNELGQLEKDKDDVFVALCEIARRWIHEEDGR